MRRRRRRKGAFEKNRGQCGAAGAARRETRSRWHCTLATSGHSVHIPLPNHQHFQR
eukprot:gene8079-biopygen3098